MAGTRSSPKTAPACCSSEWKNAWTANINRSAPKRAKFLREQFFGKYPELAEMVADMSDEEIWNLRRGGHDSIKVYNAYKRAFEHQGQPTVILAKTIKGYGLGPSGGEGRNLAHQSKKLDENDLVNFTQRFNLPISTKRTPRPRSSTCRRKTAQR